MSATSGWSPIGALTTGAPVASNASWKAPGATRYDATAAVGCPATASVTRGAPPDTKAACTGLPNSAASASAADRTSSRARSSLDPPAASSTGLAPSYPASRSRSARERASRGAGGTARAGGPPRARDVAPRRLSRQVDERVEPARQQQRHEHAALAHVTHVRRPVLEITDPDVQIRAQPAHPCCHRVDDCGEPRIRTAVRNDDQRGAGHAWMPHSTLPVPAQRPERP